MVMANQYGFDLGNVLAQAEDIRSARTRNALAEQEADRAAQARAAAGQVIGNAAPQLAGIAALDPGAATEVQNFLNGMDAKERENYATMVEQAGKAAAFVLNAEDKDAAYQMVLGQLPEELRAKAPPNYDEQQVKLWLAQASSVDQYLKSMGGGAADPQTSLGKINADLANGLIKPEQADALISAEIKKALGEVGAAGIEVGIANAIRNTVASQFGGNYDPQTGEFAGLDPTQAERALSVMAAAEKFAAAGDPPATAVQKAMQQAGPAPTAAPAAGADPLGLGL